VCFASVRNGHATHAGRIGPRSTRAWSLQGGRRRLPWRSGGGSVSTSEYLLAFSRVHTKFISGLPIELYSIATCAVWIVGYMYIHMDSMVLAYVLNKRFGMKVHSKNVDFRD
jgi:hypothetical protein